MKVRIEFPDTTPIDPAGDPEVNRLSQLLLLEQEKLERLEAENERLRGELEQSKLREQKTSCEFENHRNHVRSYGEEPNPGEMEIREIIASAVKESIAEHLGLVVKVPPAMVYFSPDLSGMPMDNPQVREALGVVSDPSKERESLIHAVNTLASLNSGGQFFEAIQLLTNRISDIQE